MCWNGYRKEVRPIAAQVVLKTSEKKREGFVTYNCARCLKKGRRGGVVTFSNKNSTDQKDYIEAHASHG